MLACTAGHGSALHSLPRACTGAQTSLIHLQLMKFSPQSTHQPQPHQASPHPQRADASSTPDTCIVCRSSSTSLLQHHSPSRPSSPAPRSSLLSGSKPQMGSPTLCSPHPDHRPARPSLWGSQQAQQPPLRPRLAQLLSLPLLQPPASPGRCPCPSSPTPRTPMMRGWTPC